MKNSTTIAFVATSCTMNLHTRKLHYKNVCDIQAPVRGQKKKMAMIIHARDEGEDIYTSPECS